MYPIRQRKEEDGTVMKDIVKQMFDYVRDDDRKNDQRHFLACMQEETKETESRK